MGVHRSDDSGTTENFTEYLNANSPDVWSSEPDGVWPLEGGEGASGTSGVIDAVTNGTGTIGYADASRAGDLGVAKIKVGEEFVEYSAEAAAAIVDESPEEEGWTAPRPPRASTPSCSSATSSAASRTRTPPRASS
jgi:phosphate transport system substrate-binding protein